MSHPAPHRPRIALFACQVFEDEIAAYLSEATEVVVREDFEVGLHDQPDRLRERLQAAIDGVDGRGDLSAIVLLYGLCGRGTAGLRAGRHPLVIARGHDCLTHFMGSKERYAAHHAGCPTCYYYTPGWNRARRVPGPDREAALRAEWAERFDEEDVAFLLESEREQWQLHDTATYIDLGTPGAEAEAAYAAECARALGWRFEHLKGDPALLRALLGGHWEDAERFQIVAPGERLVHDATERIFGVERVERVERTDGGADGGTR